jgi:hypothetical protein
MLGALWKRDVGCRECVTTDGISFHPAIFALAITTAGLTPKLETE